MSSLTPQLLGALALFAFVSSITPGPNNAMLMASGANFGLRRTLPHLAGVVIGFPVLVLGIGLGLGGLFKAYPMLHPLLQAAGAAYLLYLAYRIATARGLSGARAAGKPQTFLQAAAFQWVNPKAWAMALGAVTTYAPAGGRVASLAAVILVFAAVNAPCVTSWAAFGVGLRRFLDRPRVLRAFNLTMAALLVASLIPALVEALR